MSKYLVTSGLPYANGHIIKHKLQRLVFPALFVLILGSLGCKKGGSDLLENATEYKGPYPAPAAVTYLDKGVLTTVTAYPGQVLIYFDLPVSEKEASRLIAANGGTILAKTPAAGMYLVSAEPAKVSAFISALQADPRVSYAAPNVTGSLSGGSSLSKKR